MLHEGADSVETDQLGLDQTPVRMFGMKTGFVQVYMAASLQNILWLPMFCWCHCVSIQLCV